MAAVCVDLAIGREIEDMGTQGYYYNSRCPAARRARDRHSGIRCYSFGIYFANKGLQIMREIVQHIGNTLLL